MTTHWIADYYVCDAAREWVLQFKDPNRAWKKCPHAGWMVWCMLEIGYCPTLFLANDQCEFLEIEAYDIGQFTTALGLAHFPYAPSSQVDVLPGIRVASERDEGERRAWDLNGDEWTANDIREYLPDFPL